MKTNKGNFAASVMALAVQGALVAMCAVPMSAFAQAASDDATVADLTQPTNFVEFGINDNSAASAKFGEYNGLDKSGGSAIGNFSVKGGDAYGQGAGTKRWSVTGSDLGLTDRELNATTSDQGTWNLGVNFDQLRHNIADTYQTPFQGSMGGNSFILPPSFGAINTSTTSAGGVLTGASKGTQTLTPGQLNSFQTPDVYSQRENTSFKAGYNFDREWGVQFDYNRLNQTGAKLISSGTDALAGGPGGFNYGAESIAMLMNPTQYQTDTYNLAVNWAGDKGYMTIGGFASIFHDDYNSVSWSNPYISSGRNVQPAAGATTGTNPGAAFPLDSMSTPPSNQFYQLNMTGGYAFNSATKLSGGLSYGRNTQDDSFGGTYTPGAVPGLPVGSLNGVVVTEHADLKLTNQTTKDLILSAGFKYNKRDNQTSSNLYNWQTLGGDSVADYNIPQSNKHTQFDFGGDYRIDKRQNLHLGYEYEKIDRWCNSSPSLGQINAATSGLGNTATAMAAAAAYYALGASCAQVPESTDNKLVANYRLRASDDVNFNAGYAYSHRNATVNPSFYSPLQGFPEGFEVPGYVAFFDGSRNEQLVKAGVNWQATQKLNMSLNGRYLTDDYTDGSLGVQNGHTWSANLDGTYSLAEKSTVSAYYTVQRRTIDLTNDAWNHDTPTFGTTSATQPWSNGLSDDDDTLGVSYKQAGLMAGKLDLAADLTYSLAKSGYSTALGYANTTLGAGGTTPDVRSELTQLRLTGSYHVDKSSTMVLGYMFQHLNSNDYYYNAYQYGYTSTNMLPTNQLAPTYNMNMVFVAYNYAFK